jgi:excisionase family DNA binding protein
MKKSKDGAAAPATYGETLTLAEAADYLKLGINSTRELFDAGELPGVSLNQKHAVFLRDDLREYLHRLAQVQSADRRIGDAPSRPVAPKRRRGAPLPDLDKYSEPGA